jgi:hypothetical protein
VTLGCVGDARLGRREKTFAQHETHPALLPPRCAARATPLRAARRAAPSDWPRRASRACGRLLVRVARAGAGWVRPPEGGATLLGNNSG